MKYYSTNNKNNKVDLKTAVIKGLADDKGLYMPMVLPEMPESFFRDITKMDFRELASQLAIRLFGQDVPKNDLRDICENAFNFETPVVSINENISTLELFHGPTLAFKDVGARFMARMLGYFIADENEEVHVLVATSGDTGSAVANGFLKVPGIKVHVLYPKGLVSPLQEKQFTTLEKNITALEIDGSFDDCQRLVKQAFSDEELNRKIRLTSANSINLARLLPQVFYYFNAWRQAEKKDNLIICVPSGNFGNLTAGLIAMKMGLPIKHFIAATNINDIFPKYLESGTYTPRSSLATIANAMDVGDPSNFARILDLFNHSHKEISESISSFAYSDDEIRKTIKRVYDETGYILDPHGATGYAATEKHLTTHPEDHVIFLETAHPSKFMETVNPVIGKEVEIPDRLKSFLKKEKKSIGLSSDYTDLRDYIIEIA